MPTRARLFPVRSDSTGSGQAAITMPSLGQGETERRPQQRRRRRQTRRVRFPGAVLLRPGRLFRRNKRLDAIRLDMKAYDLGDADWLLYRHRACPYKPGTWNHRNYHRGFAASKAADPRPAWPPINW